MIFERDEGYKKPPKRRQFKPGQSGNPRGRPKKKRDGIDAIGILDQPVQVRDGDQTYGIVPKEVALRRQITAATKGDTRALFYLLAQFEKAGVFHRQESGQASGVVAVPTDMPLTMGLHLVRQFGPPPWSHIQIARGRALYLAQRDARQAAIDQLLEYDQL